MTPGLLGLLGHPHRGEVVDVVGRLGVEVPDRVVADRGEMDHGVEADRGRSLSTSRTSICERLDLGWPRAEGAGGEEVGVEPDDLVAGPLRAIGTSTEPM